MPTQPQGECSACGVIVVCSNSVQFPVAVSGEDNGRDQSSNGQRESANKGRIIESIAHR